MADISPPDAVDLLGSVTNAADQPSTLLGRSLLRNELRDAAAPKGVTGNAAG
jgi:hypothetical protein